MVSATIGHDNLVVVISGPSGSGKSTVAKRLCKADETLRLAISATTRKPRRGEVDGVDYHFLTHEQFTEKIGQGAFLEWAKYGDNSYGTLKSEITTSRQDGKDTVLEIEVNGAHQVKEQDLSPARSILIFLIPASFSHLKKRLRKRNTESKKQLSQRLEIAKSELCRIDQYDYCVINGENEIEQTVNQIQTIVAAERLRINPIKTSTFAEAFGIENNKEQNDNGPE